MEQSTELQHSTGDGTLVDVLELILDKGVVIAGDIHIKIADVDLLTIKIRLLVASVDKAKEMGISWWEHDSYLSPKAKEFEIARENAKLKQKIATLETRKKQKRR